MTTNEMHFQQTHQSPNANSISQTLLQASQYSTNETANKTIPKPTLKNTEIKDNADSQDYQTRLSDNEKALFGSQVNNPKYKRQRR